MRRLGIRLLFFGLVAAALPAQIDPNLARVRHLLEKVDAEMKEIDRMLLDTSGRAGTSVRRETKKVQETLQEAKKAQHSASENIDKLLEEMQKLADKQPKNSQPSDDPPKDDEGQGQGQQQPNAKQNQANQGQEPQQRQQQQEGLQTPDMVKQNAGQDGKQPKPEQRQPQGDPKDDGNPVSGKEDQKGGRNRPGGLPPEGAEERIRRDVEAERWGMLPKYLEFMHSRGSLPEVPDRYRRLYEAYLKSGQKPPPGAEARK